MATVSFQYLFFGFVILLQLSKYQKSAQCFYEPLLFLREPPRGLLNLWFIDMLPVPCITFKDGNIHYQSLSKVKELGSSNQGCRYAVSLTHSFPVHPFSTPWKHESCKVFWCFREVEKGCTGNEWVKLEKRFVARLIEKATWNLLPVSLTLSKCLRLGAKKFHGLFQVIFVQWYIDFGWINLGDAKFTYGIKESWPMSPETKRKLKQIT